jgi:hypothetical protein
MKKKDAILTGMIGILLVFALVFGGCDLFNSGDDGDDDDDITGTYTGMIGVYTATLVVTGSTWNISGTGVGGTQYGTYTMSGNTAILRDYVNILFGIAELDGDTLTVTLFGQSESYTLTKNSSGNNNNTNTNLVGTYKATRDGNNITLTINVGNTWTAVVLEYPSQGQTGTYTVNSSTGVITFKNASGTIIATATSSNNGNTLTVEYNGALGGLEGTYTYYKTSSSGNNGNNGNTPSTDITGTYQNSGGTVGFILYSTNAWALVDSTAGIPSSYNGTYTQSGITATLKDATGTTVVGTASLSGTTLTVYFNGSSASYPSRSYTLTKYSG